MGLLGDVMRQRDSEAVAKSETIHPQMPNYQSSGAVRKSRWTSWAPIPNKPMVSVDVKQHFNQHAKLCTIKCGHCMDV